MTEPIIYSGAISHQSKNEWNELNWDSIQRNVRRLQMRIVKATQERRWGKVKALQHLLTRSFSGKALAVKQVTENKGKRTSGVDRQLWFTPQRKITAVDELKQRGYKTSALRRIYIPKANGNKRPLGIPTMKDRAMQALYLLALDPIAETTGDPNSYGFRKGRSTADAIEQCFCMLAKRSSPVWILGYRLLSEGKLVIAKHSLERIQDKVRVITRRNRGESLETIISDLNKTLRGWGGYFQLTEWPSQMQSLESWIRRKLRCYRLKQRKQTWPIATFLISLGVPARSAWPTARSGKGWWRLSKSIPVHQAMNKDWFKEIGLKDILPDKDLVKV